MPRLIDRYILREIALPFVMILLVLTFVLLMGRILQLMDMMINKGVGLRDIASLILFLMPYFMMFTIPISLLIATLIAIGRLSGDNEITILKMSGVSLYRLSLPVLAASLIAFLLTAATSLFLMPYGNLATKNLLFDMARQKASIGIREKIFNDDFHGILIYAESIPVHGDFLEGVFIYDNRTDHEPSAIIARKAYLLSDPSTLAITLRLEEGSTHAVDPNLKYYRKMDFHFYDIRLDPAALAEGEKNQVKSSKEMTATELIEMLKRLPVEDQTYREMIIELNRKLTVPLSCLVFGLIGVPLGLRKNRSVRSRGFTIGLAVVLIYYLLRLSGEALVETGRLAPVIGTWAPTVLFAAAGACLFFLAARESSLGSVLYHRRFSVISRIWSRRSANGDPRPDKPGFIDVKRCLSRQEEASRALRERTPPTDETRQGENRR